MNTTLMDKVSKVLERNEKKYGTLIERIMRGGRGVRLTPEELRRAASQEDPGLGREIRRRDMVE